MGQNQIRGGWGVKNRQKSSDIIYVRSLSEFVLSGDPLYMNFIMKDTLLKRLFLVLIKENDNMKNIYPDIQHIKILLHTAVIR